MKKPLSERFSQGLKQWLAVLPFLAVGMTLFIVFVLYPQIKNIYIALTNYSIMPGSENTFVGISNFAKMFKDISTKGSDAYFFWIAFRNNILAVLVTVPGQLVLGLIVAVLIHNLKTGKNVYKVLLYIAVICDWVVFCNIIDYIFQPDEGSLVNYCLTIRRQRQMCIRDSYCLTTIGILKEPVAWLQNTWTGNFVIWICSIWKGYGWVMIIYTAGLLGIPSDQYEAATMDGANAVQKFFHVTLPGLRGTTLYLLINLINGAMNIFIQVFLLTKGDPLGTTDVVMDYIYRRAFNYFDFGYAAACGIVMGIVVFAISMGLKRFLRYGENL